MLSWWVIAIAIVVGCCLGCLLFLCFALYRRLSREGCPCDDAACPNFHNELKETAHFICCVVLCPPCPEQMISKIALHPPRPPNYTIEPDAVSGILIFRSETWDSEPMMLNHATPYFADTRRGNKIACLYITPNPNSRFVIVYSHQNACDMGNITLLYLGIVMVLQCNVLAYDYSGYGASTGQPSEANMKADIEAAVKRLQIKFGITKDRVILLGQSIGSVPTIHLAAKKQVAGVVIVSGLASAIRKFLPQLDCACCTRCCNPFANIDKLHLIKAPVLFVHGMLDDMIDFSHAQEMHRRCPTAVEPFWLPEATHNNVEHFIEYYGRLRQFINVDLANFTTNATSTTPSSIKDST